ncbi:tRNA1(Val) (adenine(37)-N6)-methyltransferase [Bacteroidota bacterium]
MANPWFRFKQFTIRQDRSAFKVGTDGVLLGAWAETSGVKTVLDIGTGTGLLALMLAQRTDAKIFAIEIDRSSYEQAHENIINSPWSKKISLFHSSLQEFVPHNKFDLIVSNPPFFQDSLPPDSEILSISKHNVLLSLEDLANSVPRLMVETGRFCLILPVVESLEFERLGQEHGLFLHRTMEVKPSPSHTAKRRLMQFQLSPADRIVTDELNIEKGVRHDYTDDYRTLTREFYLKF